MPNLKKMLEEARKEEAKQSPKKIIKGIRPDKILRGEITFDHLPAEKLGGKLAADKAAIEQQLGGKLAADKAAIEQQLGGKLAATRAADKAAIEQQLGGNWQAKWSVNKLSGKEADLIKILYQRCKNFGSLTTEKICSENLCVLLKISTRRLRDVIERLIEKNLLMVSDAQRGRGGWRQFRLPDFVYQEMTLCQLGGNLAANERQLGGISAATRAAVRAASAPSSSSYIDLKELTTTSGTDHHEKNSDLTTLQDSAWDKLDLDPLKDIGFNRAHVAQVKSQGLHTPQSLQDSIYAFKFDLNANDRGAKISGEPLNFFMGILRKGPYAPPPNYESPEDRQLREYLEAKENLLEARRTRLKKLQDLEFEEWMDSLPTAEIKKLAPMGTTDVLKRSQLRNHFEINIWEEKKREITEKLRAKGNGEVTRNPMLIPEKSSYTQGTIPPLNPP